MKSQGVILKEYPVHAACRNAHASPDSPLPFSSTASAHDWLPHYRLQYALCPQEKGDRRIACTTKIWTELHRDTLANLGVKGAGLKGTELLQTVLGRC